MVWNLFVKRVTAYEEGAPLVARFLPAVAAVQAFTALRSIG